MMINTEELDDMLLEIREQPVVLRNTIELNQAVLAMIRQTLLPKIAVREVDNILIVARGSSDHAAALGKYIIESKVGLPVALAAPSVINLYQTVLKLTRTVVIAISQSGQTNEVIEFMTRVKQYSGYTIGITNVPDSQLSALGLDAYLYCHAGVEKAVAATKSFTTTLMNLYLLAGALAEHDAINRDLGSIPDLVAAVLADESVVVPIGEWLATKDECIILARGYNYPIAMEISLKLQETSYIRAKAYSGADFQHGPLAITQAGVPFVILKADGPSYDGMDWLTQAIVKKDAEVYVISTQALEKATARIPVIQVPACPEWLSPFQLIVVGQMLAHHTARARGIDPAHPRWLNKVTITR